MKPLIIYHKNCADGFGAAFAAWKCLGDDAEYIPVQYGDIKTAYDIESLWQIKGRRVHILDFSLPLEVMNYVFSTAEHTTWLDHHKTAFEMYGRDPAITWYERDSKKFIMLDSDRSGTMLAWIHYADSLGIAESVPKIVNHIQDYDLWRFTLAETRAFNKALWSQAPWTFDQWDTISNFTQAEWQDFVAMGEALLRDHILRVEKHSEKSRVCLIDGKYGLAVNAPAYVASDVGHELATKSGTFGLTYTLDENLGVACSLRSIGDFDVSALAKTLGGGGHRTASGFRTDVPTLMKILVS
jgi:oligoribonuclease NrnB/cAMP/cGMP phosphodiesterase (DHH superfamily)